MVSALAALTLTGCAGFGASKVPTPEQTTLAPIPADMRVCFDTAVPKPPAGNLTRAQAFAIIAALKRSELMKSQCGKRLVQFYEAQQGPLS